SGTAPRLAPGARPQALLASLFDQLSATLGVEVHFSFGVNGDGLHLDSWAGVTDAQAQAHEARVRLNVAERVAAERRRLIVEDVTQHPAYPSMHELGVNCFVCYPLLPQGRLLGTVLLAPRRRVRFDVDELAVMPVFCDQAAVAMERARLLAELELRADALAESDRRKDEFLAMLGHELRNPLAPMVTALQLMRMRPDSDPTVLKAYRAMDRQLRHIVRLVDDLLDVSRINSGKIELRKENVDLAGVIDHAIA